MVENKGYVFKRYTVASYSHLLLSLIADLADLVDKSRKGEGKQGLA